MVQKQLGAPSAVDYRWSLLYPTQPSSRLKAACRQEVFFTFSAEVCPSRSSMTQLTSLLQILIGGLLRQSVCKTHHLPLTVPPWLPYENVLRTINAAQRGDRFFKNRACWFCKVVLLWRYKMSEWCDDGWWIIPNCKVKLHFCTGSILTFNF